jgi:hypothetical protein
VYLAGLISAIAACSSLSPPMREAMIMVHRTLALQIAGTNPLHMIP